MKLYAFLLTMILFLSLFPHLSYAIKISDYVVVFDVKQNGDVYEHIHIVLSEKLNRTTMNYIALGKVSDLNILVNNSTVDYILEKAGDEYNVKFDVPEKAENIDINFVAEDLVFAKGDVYSFFTNLNPPEADNVDIVVYLPEGFAIYRDAVFPEGFKIMSDGKRIYLEWNMEKPDEAPILFKFYDTRKDYSLLLSIFIIGVSAGVIIYIVVHYKKKVRKEFLRGFTDDERKVLIILNERKSCMQNKLEKELGFSRAKMTRIVKKLESKGLVTKERIGRTNRLFYKK